MSCRIEGGENGATDHDVVILHLGQIVIETLHNIPTLRRSKKSVMHVASSCTGALSVMVNFNECTAVARVSTLSRLHQTLRRTKGFALQCTLSVPSAWAAPQLVRSAQVCPSIPPPDYGYIYSEKLLQGRRRYHAPHTFVI